MKVNMQNPTWLELFCVNFKTGGVKDIDIQSLHNTSYGKATVQGYIKLWRNSWQNLAYPFQLLLHFLLHSPPEKSSE